MHSLRGALAVAMIGGGAPMPVVSAVLGHASSDTTQAYYLRFDIEHLRGCALDVEDVLERDRAGERGA
jgi:site-specific recombinase XerD